MYVCVYIYIYIYIYGYRCCYVMLVLQFCLCRKMLNTNVLFVSDALGPIFNLRRARILHTDTVGFHNFNLRNFNLRVSNPNKLIVDVILKRCRISMCQGLGPKNHDEI